MAGRVDGAFLLRRIGEPGDVAAWAVFLARDESAWTTGGVLVVDGATAD